MVTEEGYEIHEWKRRYRNEWRDAARYALAAAWYSTNHGKTFNALPSRLSATEVEQKRIAAAIKAQQQQAAFTTPD